MTTTADRQEERQARLDLAAALDRQAIVTADHAGRLARAIDLGLITPSVDDDLAAARERVVEADMDVAEAVGRLDAIVAARHADPGPEPDEPVTLLHPPADAGWVETYPGSGIWQNPAGPYFSRSDVGVTDRNGDPVPKAADRTLETYGVLG